MVSERVDRQAHGILKVCFAPHSEGSAVLEYSSPDNEAKTTHSKNWPIEARRPQALIGNLWNKGKFLYHPRPLRLYVTQDNSLKIPPLTRSDY